MKMRKCNLIQKLCIFSVLLIVNGFTFLYAADNQWTVAAIPFQVDVRSGSKNSIYKEFETLFPKRILDNLAFGNQRFIDKSETDQRKLYDLKKKQTANFLELSGLVKSRDSLFLYDYSERELKRKINEAEKKIEACKKKIAENQVLIDQLVLSKADASSTYNVHKIQSETEKFQNLFKNLFSTNVESEYYEQVQVYGSIDNPFIELTDEQQADFLENGLNSIFIKKISDEKKIRCILTGKVTVIDEYISVTAVLTLMPGNRELCRESEIGATAQSETICDLLSDSMLQYVFGTLPVSINVKVLNEETVDGLKFTFDDQVVSNFSIPQIFESGIHTVSFSAPGYKTLVTSYHFEGNQNYEIGVHLVKKDNGFINFRMKYFQEGTLFANGMPLVSSDQYKNTSRIEIDGKEILGIFVSEDGLSDFYYIDSKKISDGNFYQSNIKAMDTASYIDLRRKIMYGSYSAFMLSMMGWCVTYGSLYNTFAAYQQNPTIELYEKAVKWQNASKVMTGFAWGTGLLWGYTLIRYLIAADKVLPSTTKVLRPEDFEIISNEDKTSIEFSEEQDEQIQ